MLLIRLIDFPDIGACLSGFIALIVAINRTPGVAKPVLTMAKNHCAKVDVIARMPDKVWVNAVLDKMLIPRGINLHNTSIKRAISVSVNRLGIKIALHLGNCHEN